VGPGTRRASLRDRDRDRPPSDQPSVPVPVPVPQVCSEAAPGAGDSEGDSGRA
jgi:hypothetical protein